MRRRREGERTLEEVLVDDAPIGLGNDHAGPTRVIEGRKESGRVIVDGKFEMREMGRKRGRGGRMLVKLKHEIPRWVQTLLISSISHCNMNRTPRSFPSYSPAEK